MLIDFCAGTVETLDGLEPVIDSDDLSDPELSADDLELAKRFDDFLCEDFARARRFVLEECDRFTTMNALIWIIENNEEFEAHEWIGLLGEVWSRCDNIGQYKDDLLDAFEGFGIDFRSNIPELMFPEEIAALEALPDQIVIYRGCGPENRNGLSWTLDRETAISFPFKAFYTATRPILLTATLSKRRIAALKLDRNEHEVIVAGLPETCWTEEPITTPSESA